MKNNFNIKRLNEAFADKVLERAFVVEDLGKQLYAVLHGEKEETLTGVMNDFREMDDDYVETIIRLYRLHCALQSLGMEGNAFSFIAYWMYELWDDADCAKKMSSDLIYTMMNLSEYIGKCKKVWEKVLNVK